MRRKFIIFTCSRIKFHDLITAIITPDVLFDCSICMTDSHIIISLIDSQLLASK